MGKEAKKERVSRTSSLGIKLEKLGSEISVGRGNVRINILPVSDKSCFDERRFLLPSLVDIASQAFGVIVPEEEVAEHSLIGQDYLLLATDGEAIIGFVGLKERLDFDLIYLSGIAIRSANQGDGIAKLFFEAFFDRRHYDFIAFTTQNPRMFLLARKLARKLYPDFSDDATIPEEIAYLGKKIRSGRDGEFNPSSFVIKGLYGRCLYDPIPTSHDPILNEFFKTALEIHEGKTKNGFLFVGRL